jgi:hypothetical protein
VREGNRCGAPSSRWRLLEFETVANRVLNVVQLLQGITFYGELNLELRIQEFVDETLLHRMGIMFVCIRNEYREQHM